MNMQEFVNIMLPFPSIYELMKFKFFLLVIAREKEIARGSFLKCRTRSQNILTINAIVNFAFLLPVRRFINY